MNIKSRKRLTVANFESLYLNAVSVIIPPSKDDVEYHGSMVTPVFDAKIISAEDRASVSVNVKTPLALYFKTLYSQVKLNRALDSDPTGLICRDNGDEVLAFVQEIQPKEVLEIGLPSLNSKIFILDQNGFYYVLLFSTKMIHPLARISETSSAEIIKEVQILLHLGLYDFKHIFLNTDISTINLDISVPQLYNGRFIVEDSVELFKYLIRIPVLNISLGNDDWSFLIKDVKSVEGKYLAMDTTTGNVSLSIKLSKSKDNYIVLD